MTDRHQPDRVIGILRTRRSPSPEYARKVIKRIVKRALAGDLEAQRLILEQKMGTLEMKITSDDIRAAFPETVQDQESNQER